MTFDNDQIPGKPNNPYILEKVNNICIELFSTKKAKVQCLTNYENWEKLLFIHVHVTFSFTLAELIYEN